jgi:dipeptidyl aminopeptidase/acylaminoacyl peptidase
MPRRRRLAAEDLYRLETPTEVSLSPDGQSVLYGVQRVDRSKEKKYTNLWRVPFEGGAPQPFTTGDHSDTQARWSPDGCRVVFQSNRGDDKQPQLYVIDVDGGEARRLTDWQGEFGSCEWSPDGGRLLVAFRARDAEEIERDRDPARKELGVVARHITRTHYRYDGRGLLPQERWHLWTVEVTSGRTRQLTKGEHDETGAVWTPDGRQILFLSNRCDEPDHHPERIDLFAMPARGGRARRIDTPAGSKMCLAVSPDSEHVAWLGQRGRTEWWRNTNLWVARVDGAGRARDLTGKLDLSVLNVTLGGSMETSAPVWSPDGRRIFFPVSRHGETTVWSIGRTGRRDTARAEVEAPAALAPFSLNRAATRLAALRSDAHDPGQVVAVDVGTDATPRPLTRLNRWLEGVQQGDVEEVRVQGGAVQGWVLKPPGFRANRRYPSILQIHGGPYMQYAPGWHHEFQFLAAQGYVVYFCNPRGSRGYGEAHARPIDQDWGAPAYEDLMAFAERISRQSYIDRRRMGVTGGSYGGYMTNWIVGHTHRFAAAVTQRCVSNLISMWGTSDFNWNFQAVCGDRPPWENLEEYWRQSPIRFAGNVRTPTLVLHSEQDLRCDKEQGEQYYVALKRAGVETELVLFPEESHGLSRGGRTDRRVARLQHILRWFDRYLK